jgi:hypothetical protein
VSGQLHAPVALPPGKRPGTHFIEGCVDPRAGLDDMQKWQFFTLPGLELPPFLVVQPVASRYTDWAIPAPHCNNSVIYKLSSQVLFSVTKFTIPQRNPIKKRIETLWQNHIAKTWDAFQFGQTVSTFYHSILSIELTKGSIKSCTHPNILTS